MSDFKHTVDSWFFTSFHSSPLTTYFSLLLKTTPLVDALFMSTQFSPLGLFVMKLKIKQPP